MLTPQHVILQLFIGSVPGGVLQYVVTLAKGLRQRGLEVRLAGQRGAWHAAVEDAGLEWLEIPISGGPIDLWHSYRKLRSRLPPDRPLIIHAHHRRAAIVGRLLQRAIGSPLLYSLHMPFIPMGMLRRRFTIPGDMTHVASQGAKRWLLEQRLQREDRIAVIPHGIDPKRYPLPLPQQRRVARELLGIRTDEPLAGFVGRFDDPKNESWAADVAAALRQASRPGRVILAGDGPRRAALEDRIAQQRLADRLTLLGECDPVPLYHAADLLLVPSRIEGFSYACAEGMSCGVPVLRTQSGGAEETIVENVTGRCVPVDRDRFVAAALDLLSDRDRLAAMGQAAATHVRTHLSLDRQIERTLELYERLGKPGSSTREQ